ncbi:MULTISPECIES: class I SAM-dependent methyltransferase [Nostoc]|uniref:Class I SAM-dependent methyltransferase n=2 Tax=Nostoc TaxID=1177 RepID=A0ABR8IBH5_9NOSO|nr:MULTISPECIES: class I SAM-dependent methyltransferase [Nostoc]MBD2563082.1 class I SAM-dependent methyltransferase [Nostoc linckia FACHB-391]MBD2648167.1 class I SAM-dependent methyltransferase [Nostoc foliaceum FACHB-393]
MISPSSDLLDKIRQQFDASPYPRIPLDKSPKNDTNSLYIHNLVTPYYLRNQKVIDPKGKVILDAGCGTGYKSLILAEANPGAKIVGIDISEESIKLARQRLEHHGFDNAEFHVLPIEELPELDYQFDYINCDELLYLFPDLTVALQAMKSVLKPDGIIRSNLHSSIQRFNYFRAQKVFTMMGLMDENPEDLEMGIVVETMKALKDNVQLKATTWNSNYEGEDGKERILMNYLFHGDKGYTISDLFTALRAADLDFISMVNWRKWDLMNLFKEPDNLPAFLGMSLPEISVEQQLQLFELIHPIHRLIDFWCGHPNQAQTFVPVSEWTDSDWRVAKVHLYPQLKTPNFREDLVACITEIRAFPISQYLSPSEEFVGIDSSIALCLIPLLEQPQSMISLVQHWKQFRPIDPVTLKPTDEKQAFYIVQQLLLSLESLGYIMLERQSDEDVTH